MLRSAIKVEQQAKARTEGPSREVDSPSRHRINLIQDKWIQIQMGIEKDKVEKKEHLEEKIKAIEDAVQYQKPKVDEKLRVSPCRCYRQAVPGGDQRADRDAVGAEAQHRGGAVGEEREDEGVAGAGQERAQPGQEVEGQLRAEAAEGHRRAVPGHQRGDGQEQQRVLGEGGHEERRARQADRRHPQPDPAGEIAEEREQPAPLLPDPERDHPVPGPHDHREEGPRGDPEQDLLHDRHHRQQAAERHLQRGQGERGHHPGPAQAPRRRVHQNRQQPPLTLLSISIIKYYNVVEQNRQAIDQNREERVPRRQQGTHLLGQHTHLRQSLRRLHHLPRLQQLLPRGQRIRQPRLPG